MSLVTPNLLADALFARKLIKTIKNKNYHEAEHLLQIATEQMEDAKNGRIVSQNYRSSSKDDLTLLKAYGTVIAVVKSLKQFDGEDCIGEYIKTIQKELDYSKKLRKVNTTILKQTIRHYEQVITFAIEEDITYNETNFTNPYWEPIVKH